jgi:hypothetical protein
MNKDISDIKLKWRQFKKWLWYQTIHIVPLVLIGFGFAFFLWVGLSRWYDENRVVFAFPLEYHPPIVIQPRKVKEVIISTPIKIEKKDDSQDVLIERFYQMTRYLESHIGFDSEGTAGYCQSIGKVNEIGYFYKGNKQFCFENEAGQHKEFTWWVKSKLKVKYSLQEAFCEYVTGTRQPQCKRSIDLGL